MEGRQLSALGMVQSFFFGVFGWCIYKHLSAGLLYLFFLVPFGAFLVPELQAFTTSFTAFFLTLLGIPNYVHEFTIQISAGSFEIAQACAGLRFLVAAIAFSVFYAFLFFRSPYRRVLFIALSLVVPVIANGFRALGIVWLGAQLGSAQAAATDHVLYGYIFFSFVIGILIFLGLPFREDQNQQPAGLAKPKAVTQSPSATKALLLALAMVIGTTGLVSWTGHLDRLAASGVLPPRPELLGCESWHGVAETFITGSGARTDRFTCDGGAIMANITTFPPRTDPSVILDAYRKISQEDDPNEFVFTTKLPVKRLPNWEITVDSESPRTTFSTLVFNHHSSLGNLMFRIAQARYAMTGAAPPPSIIAVSTSGDDSMATARLERFIDNEHGFP
jgi:exosortase